MARIKYFARLFLWVLLIGIAAQAQAFQVQVSNVYYSDSVRTVNNYDFTDGTKTGDIITIPDGFVTKPSGESALSYTYGLYPGTRNMTFSWTKPSPCVLEVTAGHANGAAIISTTPSLPDSSSAQTAFTYTAKLQSFADVSATGKTYQASAGMGSDTATNQPKIKASWLSNGDLRLQAMIGDNSPLWQSGAVTQSGLTPLSTTVEIKLENTGSAINFYYNLNSGGWTLLGTFGSGDGYVADNFKGFPSAYPFVSLDVNDAFRVQSLHEGTNYSAMIFVEDSGQSTYDSISVASSGTACGTTLPSTALVYDSGRGEWWLNSGVAISTGSTPSCFPEYTFTAVKKAGGTDTVTRTVTGYVELFATGLLPIGNVGGAPTFSWSGINGATGYYVQLNDSSYIWLWGQSTNAPVTRLDYTGTALTSGTYYYYVNSFVDAAGQTNMSVASSSFTYDSTATYAYTFRVKDSSGNPLEGVAVEMLGNSVLSTATGADGRFMLDGLPFGTAVSVKMSKTGYTPVYSQDIYYLSSQNIRNVTGYRPINHVMYSPATVAAWGVTSGNGVINGRIIDQNSIANLSGAVVTYTSALAKTYAVKYVNDSGVLVDGPSTFSNGIYMILNVVDGDTLIITATKSGYNFTPRVFRTHANAVTQSSIFGTPRVFSKRIYSDKDYYYMNANFGDATDDIASITLSGPGISSPVSLGHNSFNRVWMVSQFLSNTEPTLSTPYTLTITYKAGGGTTENHTVSGFVGLPSNILPAAGSTVYGNPTFSWTGSAVNYYLNLMKSSNSKLFWANHMLTSTSVTYDGFLPLSGSYSASIESYDAAGNCSQYIRSFICYTQSLYVDFSGYGIWKWNGADWTQTNVGETTKMAASGSNLYANFEGYGLWQWNGTDWSQLNPGLAANMTASGSNLYVDFTGYGIWVWNGTTWSQINSGNSTGMTASGANLYANFPGYGIWKWNGVEWSQINTGEATGMTAAGSNLYANFTGYGIWRWNGTDWSQINATETTSMVASGSNLYANFSGYGLWQWNGTTWSQINTTDVAGMTASSANLFANFAGYGLWKWNGSAWSQVNTTEAAVMVVGE